MPPQQVDNPPPLPPAAAVTATGAAVAASVAPAAYPKKKLKKMLRALFGKYVGVYDAKFYQEALQVLEVASKRYSTLEEWAKAILMRLWDNAQDPHALAILQAQETCLQLILEMMSTTAETSVDQEALEEAVASFFKERRLERILSYVVPLLRARVIYGLPSATALDWWCEEHLKPNTVYARLFPSEQEEWKNAITPSSKPTMEKGLFRLIYSTKFTFRDNPMFLEWARPQRAQIAKL